LAARSVPVQPHCNPLCSVTRIFDRRSTKHRIRKKDHIYEEGKRINEVASATPLVDAWRLVPKANACSMAVGDWYGIKPLPELIEGRFPDLKGSAADE
jgi:hypothetical protein